MVKQAKQATPNRQLQAARKAHGWTQRQLAERIGAPSPLNVTRWEQGMVFPSTLYREKLCHLFGKTPGELGLFQQERPIIEQPSNTSNCLPPWMVPYRRNLFFTGREDMLTQVREHLVYTPQTARPPAYALSGLGGIGKTQLALEYAYRFRQAYQAIFWVRATSRETLLTDFLSLARLLALPQCHGNDPQQIVATVKHWLVEHELWLLILDNADDLSLVPDFLPVGGQGHLLLTTRAAATGNLACSLAVKQMERDEGVLLLLRRSKVLAVDAPLASIAPPLRRQARTLVDLFDGLPLALDQAGAYIEESGCSLSEYLELYQRRRAALLNWRGAVLSDYPYTVASTWSLSFRQVEQENPAAAALSRLTAFLDPDGIAESLIGEGASLLGPELGPVAADPFRLNEAVQVLRRFSLVERHPETNKLSLHRLVQTAIQEEMDARARQEWLERAVSLLKAAYPDPFGKDFLQYEPEYRELLPHVLVCADLIERSHLLTLDGAQLLRRAALYLASHYTRNVLAERLARLALSIYEHHGLLEHPDAADLFTGLGLSAWAMGRFEQAHFFYQRALDIQRRVLGPDHVSTAASYDDLGNVHWILAHYDQAEAMYYQALTLMERALDPDHVRVTAVLGNLGILSLSQKRYEQAEAFLQRALAILERHLNLHHSSTAYHWSITFTLGSLGEVYAAQGRYEEAESLLLRTQALYAQAMGPDFIMVGPTLSNLAEVYKKQGRSAEAEVAYRQALAIFEQEPESDNPILARAFARLATFYAEQDRVEEARPLYHRALGMYERSVGTNHPEAVETREHYATLLRNMTPSKEPGATKSSSYEPSLVSGEQDHGRTNGESPSLPHAQPATDPLTRREKEVLRLLAQGLTNAQISEELTISIHTVSTHIRSIYNKLGSATRSAATRYALEHQLL